VLGVLRADDGDPALGPAHGLAEIPQLIADLREAGVEVSLSSEGVPDTLPSGVDLASYRIVQEALTNVLKHGGTDPTAEVNVSAADGMLTLEVVDHGSGVSTVPGSGQGLVGMRERATQLGGTFDAGPRADGGFRVAARLPLEEALR
jgi:signal transduction histidine kinase